MAGVALAHDYLTQRGGAERVLAAMAREFPDAAVHTALYDRDATHADFNAASIHTLWPNAIPGLRHHHRWALPVLAPAFSTARVDAPVTLVSSSGWAHGIRVSGRKVVYCHAPARWLHQRQRYLGARRRAAGVALRVLAPRLLAWDRRALRSADRILCNSLATQELLRAGYGVEAEVLHPPPGLDPDGPCPPVSGVNPGHLLCVSRLLPYKNVDAVVGAAALMPDCSFVVAGDGPERNRLQASAGPNVTFVGGVGDAHLRWLYANCAGLIAPAHEDFGLTVLEAAQFGKPVAALRWGGYLETVREGETGLFFESPAPATVAEAAARLIGREWSAQPIRTWAGGFAEAAFRVRLRAVIEEELERA